MQVKQLAPLQQLEFLEAMQSQQSVQQSCALADGKAEAALGGVNQSHCHTSGKEVNNGSYSQVRCSDQRHHQGPAQDVAAFGRLIVQLYRGRRIYHRPSDQRWVLPHVRSAPSLPAPTRHVFARRTKQTLFHLLCNVLIVILLHLQQASGL